MRGTWRGSGEQAAPQHFPSPSRQTQSPLLRVAHGGSPDGHCSLKAEGKERCWEKKSKEKVSESNPPAGRLSKGREQRTRCAPGVRVCKGRTGALPLALLKAKVTVLFPPRPSLGTWSLGPRWILVFPMACRCSMDAAQPGALKGMLVADAPPGGAGSSLSEKPPALFGVPPQYLSPWRLSPAVAVTPEGGRFRGRSPSTCNLRNALPSPPPCRVKGRSPGSHPERQEIRRP